MRIEFNNGSWVLCGEVIPLSALSVGQKWQSASGSIVEIVEIDGEWVSYSGDKQPLHTKDNFSFQCKHSIVLENFQPPEILQTVNKIKNERRKQIPANNSLIAA